MPARLPRKAGLDISKYVNQRASTSLAAHLWCCLFLPLSLDPSSSAIPLSGVVVKRENFGFHQLQKGFVACCCVIVLINECLCSCFWWRLLTLSLTFLLLRFCPNPVSTRRPILPSPSKRTNPSRLWHRCAGMDTAASSPPRPHLLLGFYRRPPDNLVFPFPDGSPPSVASPSPSH